MSFVGEKYLKYVRTNIIKINIKYGKFDMKPIFIWFDETWYDHDYDLYSMPKLR